MLNIKLEAMNTKEEIEKLLTEEYGAYYDNIVNKLLDLYIVIWRCTDDLKYDCDSGNCFTKGNIYEQVDINNKQGLIILRSNYKEDVIISGTTWKKYFIAI